MRQRFYKVPESSYLFVNAVNAADLRDAAEEPVRQWCAFELIRAYGILVGDIVFEEPVKVGSKQYRIDILIKRNGFPWIVVECKQPNHRKHAAGLEQAISYANAQGIQAEFAVYTNGHEWHVKRRIQREWVEVPDLPNLETGTIRPLREILGALYEISPLVHRLDEPISGQDAQRFFEAMQRFFCGHNLLTESNKPPLVHGTDNILRVISVERADAKYLWGKLGAAAHDWGQYRFVIGAASDIHDVDTGGMFAAEVARIRADLEELIRGPSGLRSCDVLLLRLDIALLNYAERAARKKDQFLPVGHDVHGSLREFLNYGLMLHFNTQIPDPIDGDSTSDVKSYCGIIAGER